MKPKPVRLDKLLADRELAVSRTAAREYIESGRVSVDGITVLKPASCVLPGVSIKIDSAEHEWVSRGAHKLIKALDDFLISPDDKVCLDVGASTGGFTDVLLSRGAKRVYAVDVGYGQMAWKLRSNPKVVVMERTNARFLTEDSLSSEKAAVVVSDASFISLRLLLNPMSVLLERNGDMVVLVKPQFEVGKDKIGKGVVKDPALHLEVLENIFYFVEKETELRLKAAAFSPITGPCGNIEFLFHLRHRDDDLGFIEDASCYFRRLVDEAHGAFLREN